MILNKGAKAFNVARIVFSTNGAGIMRQPHEKKKRKSVEIYLILYIRKKNSKWIIDLLKLLNFQKKT